MPHKEEKPCEGPGLMRTEKDENSENGDQQRKMQASRSSDGLVQKGDRSEDAVDQEKESNRILTRNRNKRSGRRASKHSS